MPVKTKYRAAALLAFVLSGSPWGIFCAAYRRNLITQEKVALTAKINDTANLLTSVVNRRQALLDGLEALVKTRAYGLDIEEDFNLYAAGITDKDPSIRAVQIFRPQGRVLVYPLAGNEATAGLSLRNLLNDERPAVRADVERTVRSRRVTLSDPYELRQGGLGLIARKALYTGNDIFWGLAVVILDVDSLLSYSGIGTATGLPSITLKDNSGTLFYGREPAASEITVESPITLPEGAWTIGASLSPEAQRDIAAALGVYIILGLAISLGIAFGLYAFLMRMQALKGQVRDSARLYFERDEDYRSLFEESGEGIFVFAPDGTCLTMNPAAYALLGQERNDGFRPRAGEILHPWEGFQAIFAEQAGNPRAAQPKTYTVHREEGHTLDVEFLWRRRPDGSYQGTARDITVRKKKEEKIKKAEEEARRLLKLADDSLRALLSVAEDQRLTEAKLRRSEELLHETGAMAKVGGWELVPATGELTWTKEVAAIHDLESSIRPDFAQIMSFYTPKSRARIERAIRAAEEQGESYDLELELLSAKNVPKWVRIIGRPVYAEGKFARIRGSLQDISDMHNAAEALRLSEDAVRRANADLEQRVAQRTAQLEYANKELEAFAYSVSHDLRAPLRAIDGFSRFLEEDYSRFLDQEGLRLLGVIRKNTQRMDRLISDLLSLSRVARNEMRIGEVDMGALARSAWEDVSAAEGKGTFDITFAPLPPVTGDASLLSQVWHNLIGNACKYSLKSENRTIEIGFRETEKTGAFYVKDYGAGFDPKYTDKLFGVFQRLHKADEFEGNGVGLAIVQRILARHGGTAWAESAGPGQGATFYFSIPDARSTNHE